MTDIYEMCLLSCPHRNTNTFEITESTFANSHRQDKGATKVTFGNETMGCLVPILVSCQKDIRLIPGQNFVVLKNKHNKSTTFSLFMAIDSF